MATTPVSAEDMTTDPHDTVTKIRSQAVLRVSRVALFIVFVLAIIVSLQLLFGSLAYHQQQARLFITDGFLSAIFPWAMTIPRGIASIVFLGVGAIIFLRRSDDRIALLTSLFLIAFGVGGVGYADNTLDPSAYIAENNLYGFYVFSGAAWAVLFAFIYLFPDGRFVPRWMVVPLVLFLLLVVCWAMPSDSSLYPGNWDGLLFAITHIPAIAFPIGSQIYRFRKVSTQVQRQQTKWVLYAIGLALIVEVSISVIAAIFPETFARGTIIYDLIGLIMDIPYILLPIALAFAMLRSRLWDIDLIINRSLVYGVVAASGILIFFGAMVGLQLAVGQTQPIVALIISAALSAAIFNPLHKRIQNIVDRHIYHLRFDINELHHVNKAGAITNPGALSGKVLGKYEVLDVLGKGGMGEVYKASDGSQTVAIKTLLKDIANTPEIIKRFQREAEAGQVLNHPNIARVHDIAEHDGTIYMVMDYLEGQDLAAWLKRHRKLDLDMARGIVHGITAALDHAHTQGFVHRDIKPSNIMLVQNDAPGKYRSVLMDFGITKIKDANTLTGTGAIGTIDYMAPEQIMNARAVDHRADIYALGVLLYEMLTGTRPFSGGPAQVMFAHIQQPAPDPRDVNPDLPRPIAKAITRALEKSPDDRFNSALELFEVFN